MAKRIDEFLKTVTDLHVIDFVQVLAFGFNKPAPVKWLFYRGGYKLEVTCVYKYCKFSLKYIMKQDI